MEAIENWNEYCEMLEDLESPLEMPEENAAYLRWLEVQNERFDAERAADFATY